MNTAPTVAMSKLRVAERVAHGGHSIPDADIERRFPRSLRNLLEAYGSAADYTCCFTNIGEMPELIFIQQGNTRNVLKPELFEYLENEAQR
jgi:predicted ABC-type ATPase